MDARAGGLEVQAKTWSDDGAVRWTVNLLAVDLGACRPAFGALQLRLIPDWRDSGSPGGREAGQCCAQIRGTIAQ